MVFVSKQYVAYTEQLQWLVLNSILYGKLLYICGMEGSHHNYNYKVTSTV